ncbi:hypothetical protein BG011_005798 [Mortierella polycephala]|uniref:TOG domain-containing protein n=1 Tax=Mortierella polycephala TaxID=41804 RepID=A0A9P6U0W1_9FUNG|nr:hypothetical protein BG011_005798 [Mortierella polycephala]
MVLAPQRLPYEIQMASGWDTGFPPEELVGLMQTSAGKGWHTPRFCPYPQDLVLRFSCGHSRIRKIQILSHQYKIASRLDFWIGSRKGAQAVATDVVDEYHPSRFNEAGQDDSYGAKEDDTVDLENNRLDFLPRMPQPKHLPVLQFQKLGSISFDSNSASNYSGRELKSINVNIEGEYLRVVIRQCHANPLNIYHQVGILALNVLGEPLEDELLGDSERLDFDDCKVVNGPGHGLSETSLHHSAHPTPETQSDVSNLTDAIPALSISEIKDQPANYMDQEIQSLAQAFIKAKLDAVKVEDFQSAKLFKTGYEEMIQYADEIQALDIEKHQAAENDDFDLAQDLKAKVTEVKARMNSRLSLSGFYTSSNKEGTVISLTPLDEIDGGLDSDSPLPTAKGTIAGNVLKSVDTHNMSSGSIGSNGRRHTASRRSIPASTSRITSSPSTSDHSSDPDRFRRENYPGKLPLSSSRTSSMSTAKQHNDSMYSRTQSPYATAPSSKNSTSSTYLGYSMSAAKELSLDYNNLNHEQDENDTVHSERLTELEQKNMAVSLQVFSSKVVARLINRDLRHRLHAIEFVKEHLENEDYADDNDQGTDHTLLSRAVFQVISVVLTDTREKVIMITLALLDQAVRFCLQNEIPSDVTYRSLEPIFSLLLVKASDLNTRVAEGAVNRIVILCNCFRSYPYAILPLVFKPAKSTVLYRQSQSRVEVVARLVDEFGVYDRAAGKGTAGGLDFENITGFAIPYLSHTNGEVRVATRRLIIDVCKFLSKTRVEQFLPGVKPLIVESIQKELDPKKTTSSAMSTSNPQRPTPTTLGTLDSSAYLSADVSGSRKRRPIPTPLGVNLHMDSLKSLLVEPDSPGLSRSTRQSSRQRSDAAIAHQARLKMPLRSSAKATQDLYSGVSRTMVKRQNALSPEDENDSTASEEIKPSVSRTALVAPRSPVRPVQSRAKSNSFKSTTSRQDMRSGTVSSSSSQKGGASSSKKTAKDRFCVFCDEHSSAFTDEGLVAHYWSDCVMLANCAYCKIVGGHS